MIDIDENDIVAVRHTSDGRFLIFTRTDMLPRWNQHFWGVTMDTGADGHGTLVRYGPASAPIGWSARQLIMVVRATMAMDHERAPDAGARAVLEALDGAKAFHVGTGTEPIQPPAPARTPANGDPTVVTFHPGSLVSPYAWTDARCGDLSLPLCPDPASRDEGIAPEQVLIVIEQMLFEWMKLSPHRRPIQEAHHAVKAALTEEVERVTFVRRVADSAGPSV